MPTGTGPRGFHADLIFRGPTLRSLLYGLTVSVATRRPNLGIVVEGP
jgi:hypothetical protein